MKSQTWFALGQIILGACLAYCLYLIPRYFFSLDQGGVSNYGTLDDTKWVFTAGFAAAAIGALFASITAKGNSTLKFALFVLAVMYAAMLATTFSYKLNDSLNDLHQYTSITLFVVMFIIALWLQFTAKDSFTKICFAILLLGLIAGALTLAGVIHVLFSVQIVCGVAFAFMITHGIKKLQK
ncbi:MAG: hypothetical protein WBP26_00295 [Candidatus Saccharimonadales bacterium]